VNIENYDGKVNVMWSWTWLDKCSSDGEDSSNFSSEDVAEISDENNNDHNTSNAILTITHSGAWALQRNKSMKKHGKKENE